MKSFIVLLISGFCLFGQTVVEGPPKLPLNPAGGGGGGNPFVLSGHGLVTRHDFTGLVGYKFTPSANMTVTALGRLVLSGNSASHTVYLEDASGTLLASASVSMSGATADTYVYANISTVSLTSGTAYYLLSGELNGGDDWFDNTDGAHDALITHTSDAAMNTSAFVTNPNSAVTDTGGANIAFGHPNFKYTIP